MVVYMPLNKKKQKNICIFLLEFIEFMDFHNKLIISRRLRWGPCGVVANVPGHNIIVIKFLL